MLSGAARLRAIRGACRAADRRRDRPYGLAARRGRPRGAGLRRLLELLGTGKVWVKLSAPYYGRADPPGYPFATAFARRLYAARPDRMLFGTNWPHPQADPVPDEGDLVDWIAAVTAGEVGLRQVLVDNPARLYGFPVA